VTNPRKKYNRLKSATLPAVPAVFFWGLFIMGLLNSKLLSKYLSKISTPFIGGFWSCNRQYLEQLPIAISTEKNQADVDKITTMGKQIIVLKNKKDDKCFKDAVFLEGEVENIVQRLYGV
jgi:hypothetical protein